MCSCAKCGAPASVQSGVVVPSCRCAAGFIGSLSAVAKGAGGVRRGVR